MPRPATSASTLFLSALPSAFAHGRGMPRSALSPAATSYSTSRRRKSSSSCACSAAGVQEAIVGCDIDLPV